MSVLNELIKKHCPNGVEYKKLGEIATITRGGSLQKKDFCESGIPCIHYGQIYTRYGLTATETYTFISEEVAAKQRFAEPGDIVMAVTSENVDDICKCVAWLGEEKNCSQWTHRNNSSQSESKVYVVLLSYRDV